MLFTNDRGDTSEQIQDLSSWERLAGPVSAGQWKPGRSARELARDWIEGDAQGRTEALLSLHPDLRPVTLESATAEKKTYFDDLGRGPRNHDLLVLGTAARGPIVVGVEGKADEPFGETLAKYRDKQRSEGSRALDRLERLTVTLFGTTLEREPALENIGYQLCSALAGTLADAKTEEATAAVLLVHEFRTAATTDRLHRRNEAALNEFVSRLRGNPSRHQRSDDWIAGPWRISGDDRWLPATMQVFVAKLVTDLSPPEATGRRG